MARIFAVEAGVAAAALASALFAQCVCAGELGDGIFPGDVNVRDFGAVGDGVHDDTAAIAAAGKAAQKHDLARRADGKSGEWDGPHAAVVFPAGTYRVTDTVFFGRDAHLRGAGEAWIVSDRTDRDIFYFHTAARTRVDGLKFRGGRNQLNVTTLNHENANAVVRDCEFHGAASNAIRSVSRIYRGSSTNAVRKAGSTSQDVCIGEFMPDKNGVFAPDPRYFQAQRYNNSTFILIEGCKFVGCAHATDTHTDGTVVRNCRVVQPAVAGATFNFCTAIHLYDIDVTVERAKGVDQSVVRMYSSSWASLENVNVRTTDGGGVLFIDSFATTSWVIPSILFVRDCRVSCGGCPEGAIARFRTGNAVGLLVMDGITDVTGRKVKALAFESEFSESDLCAVSKRTGARPLDEKFAYSFGKFSPNVDTDVGPLFGRFVRKYPDDLPKPPIARRPVRRYAGKVLKATDFGIGVGKATSPFQTAADDTDAMERFVAALAASPGSIGVLPAEWITLTRPVTLAGDFALIGSGTAGFRHNADKGEAYFRVANGAKVKFKDLYFWDTKHILSYREKSAEPTSIVVENCFAHNSTRYDAYKGAAFDVHADENPGAVEFTLTAGSYYQAVLYRGNARAFLDGFWLRTLPEPSPDEPLKSSVCIVNERGGVMRAADVLGVPCTLAQLGWGASNDPKVAKGDFRWVDNHGEFCSQFFRYGGEYGGLTPVYNYDCGKVFIEGGFGEYKAFSCRQALIYGDGTGGDLRVFGTVHLSRPPLKEHDSKISYDSTIWIRQ